MLPSPVQTLCSDAETTACSRNLNETRRLCTQLEKNLTGPIFPTTYNCSAVLPKCLLLEGFCGTNTTEPCRELFRSCYNNSVEGVFDHVLLTIFAPDLWSNPFETIFKSKCLDLEDKGEGFMRSCLNWTRTRDRLRDYHEEKCIELDKKIGHLMQTFQHSTNSCPHLKDACNDYGRHCNHTFPRCNQLRELCPDGFRFTPLPERNNRLTSSQLIDIDVWFDKVYQKLGIIVGSSHKVNSFELLYWLLYHWLPNPSLDRCETFRTSSCDLISFFSEEMNNFCMTGYFYHGGKLVCPELQKLDYPLGQKDLFRATLEGKGVSPREGPWLGLNPDQFDRDYCHKHSQHCTLLVRPGDDPLLGPRCSNFVRTCYRGGRRNSQDLTLVNLLIQYLLREKKPFGPELCRNWLNTKCSAPRFPSLELMEDCLYPTATCNRLGGLIEQRCSKLWGTLVTIRSHNQTSCAGFTAECRTLSNLCDPFYLKECPKLQEKCSKLRN